MRIFINILVSLVFVLAFGTSLTAAAPYLEIKTSCQGWRSDTTNRFKIIGWNGQSKRAFSQKVYNFKIECNGSSKFIVDVFMAAANSERYKKEGGTVYKHQGTKQQRIKTRERQCDTYYEDDWCERSRDDLFAICGNNDMCKIENSAYRCKRKRENCASARYETKTIPIWEPFPKGYAPLPSGANIVDVAPNQQNNASSQVSNSTVKKTTSTQRLLKRNSSKTTFKPTNNSDDGPGVGSFLLFVLAAGVGFVVYRNRKNAPLQNQINEVRQNINREYSGFGIDIQAEGFGANSSGFNKNDPELELSSLNMDLTSLKNCRQQHQKTKRLLDELEKLCIAKNHHNFDEEIEKTKKILKSEDLLSQLIKKEWRTYCGFVSDISDYLRDYIGQMHNINADQSQAYSGGKQGFRPESGDLPTSLKEAYILLNIGEGTSIDVAKKIYRAMAQAWHVDHADGDEDRRNREQKMKQLNAAKEFITGKR